MDTLQPFSWLCHECWRTLFDFHKFYMRIEEAHMDFGLLVKTKIEVILKDEKDVVPSDEYKNNDESNDLFESHLDSDISVDPLVTEDHKPIVKADPDDEKSEDNVPIIQRHKRGQKSKDMTNDTDKIDETPFKNFKKSNSSKYKISKKRKKAIAELTQNLDTSSDCDSDSNTDSDCYAEKKSLRLKTSISQNNNINIPITSSDSDDSSRDSDYKPEVDCNQPPKQTSKEIDQFLTDNFKLTCVFCQISMSTFKTLLKHCEMEHKEQGYVVCCDKKFYRRMVLVEHVHHHVNPSNFKCSECGKEMTSRKALKSHQIVHLSEEQKKFTCSKCGKNFAARSILSNHIKAVHLKKYLKICDICGKSLRNESFERHMLEHEGKPVPQVNCDICGLLLSNKRNLKRHVNMQHPVGGEQSHNCHLCPKISPNICALKEHIRRVHLVGNVHKCTMCGRGFKRKLALKEHMATHTGIALYTCPWCPKTFNANSSMHAHRKRQHPVEWEQAQKQQKIVKYITPNALEIKNTDLQ